MFPVIPRPLYRIDRDLTTNEVALLVIVVVIGVGLIIYALRSNK